MMDLKAYIDGLAEKDVEELKVELPTLSPSIIALLSYRLGAISYEILRNGHKNDNLEEAEKEYDKIGKKIEVIILHLNAEYRTDDESEVPSESSTGNEAMVAWLKRIKL
jgi:hypothetical protein